MDNRVQRSIAYLKAEIPASAPDPVVSLSFEDSPVLRKFVPGLLAAYLVDDGDRFSYIQGRDLREAGVGEDQLHFQAVSNLARFADGKLRIQRSGLVWALFLDGNLEASLIMLDGLWDGSLREYVRSPVVAVPARDVIAFCDSSSADGISELRAVVDRVWPGGNHLLSRDLYRRQERNWHVVVQTSA
ncbi:MAG: hypothetical protein V1809_10975 [Planctomycetota bacterium]